METWTYLENNPRGTESLLLNMNHVGVKWETLKVGLKERASDDVQHAVTETWQ